MNHVSATDGTLRCTCGATASDPKDFNRFRRRHPEKCDRKAANIEASKQLAQGTKCVEVDEWNDPIYLKAVSDLAPNYEAMAQAIHLNGTGLTSWEEEFMGSVYKFLNDGTPLSDKMIKHLKKIYETRVSL